MSADNYVRWFSDIRLSDVRSSAARTHRWVSYIRALSAQGMRVPNGFALTAQAYRDALTEANAWEPLHKLLDSLDRRRVETLAKRAAELRQIVYRATGNDELRRQAVLAYRQARKTNTGPMSPLRYAALPRPRICRRQALPDSTKAFSTCAAPTSLFEACRHCFASMFTDRAISYRIDNGFDHFKVALSVGVMKMVRADLAASGVIFTLDTESGFPRCGVHHRRLWAGRKHRAGHGRP